MNTIAAYFPQMDLRLRGIEAAGTSQGAKLGWDTRGRGRHISRKELRKAILEHAATKKPIKPEHLAALLGHIDNDVKDIDHLPLSEKVKRMSFLGTMIHKVGGTMQDTEGVRDLAGTVWHVAAKILEYAIPGGIATFASAHAGAILAWAHSVLLPIFAYYSTFSG